MSENVKCEACSTVSPEDAVYMYTDGWSCPECHYFNNSTTSETTQSDTVFKTVESEESEEVEMPEEIARMISVLLILGVIQFMVNLPWIIVGAFTIIVCSLGCIEYVYVKSLSKESRSEYREKRKKLVARRRAEASEFIVSAIFVIGLMISIFYILEVITS